MIDYARAEASNLSKSEIFKLAEEVANQIDFAPGDDINEAVSRLGGEVVIQDAILQDPEHTGSLYVEGVDKFTIIIPSHTSPQRDRFTIAHELGHYVLHYLFRYGPTANLGKMMAMRRDSHRVEWEANWFAAAFLMPENAFRQSYAAFGGNVEWVAGSFGVSKLAAEIRAKSLDLVA